MNASKFSLILVVMSSGCAVPPRTTTQQPASTAAQSGASYRDDLKLLREHTSIIELQQGSGKIAVAPALQGRVMTSGVSGGGLSLGWVNRAAITAGEQHIQFNNYGGEERFWLAPEGGQFTLFHKKGDPQNYDTWWVPDAFDKGGFDVVRADAASVQLRRSMNVVNAEGTPIHLNVERSIRAISRKESQERLGMKLAAEVADVGFVSDNRITNIGQAAFKPETGTVAIWMLGMFPGRDHTVVIAPYVRSATGPQVNTAYFPDQPASRIIIDRQAGVLLFRADGDCRSKFGLTAAWAKDRLGSIDFANRVLTIVLFDRPAGAAQYVNCLMRQQQADPYAGDVINSYNHYNGLRFYELESASPAAFLGPGESMGHVRYTLQFCGPIRDLSQISKAVLGIELERVQRQIP